MELKQNTSIRVPVQLRDSATGALKTGIAYTSVTCYVQKQAGSSASKTVLTTDWWEIDATHMPGYYNLLLGSGDVDTLGFFVFNITATGCDPYVGLFQVVANLEADTYTRIGAPVGASISADIAGVITSIFKLDLSTITGESARSLINAIRVLRNKVVITGTTISVKKEDDTTEAWHGTLATDPLAQPVVGIAPA